MLLVSAILDRAVSLLYFTLLYTTRIKAKHVLQPHIPIIVILLFIRRREREP